MLSLETLLFLSAKVSNQQVVDWRLTSERDSIPDSPPTRTPTPTPSIPRGVGAALVTDTSALNNSFGPGCLKVRRSSAWAQALRRGGTVIKYLLTCCTP